MTTEKNQEEKICDEKKVRIKYRTVVALLENEEAEWLDGELERLQKEVKELCLEIFMHGFGAGVKFGSNAVRNGK